MESGIGAPEKETTVEIKIQQQMQEMKFLERIFPVVDSFGFARTVNMVSEEVVKMKPKFGIKHVRYYITLT